MNKVEPDNVAQMAAEAAELRRENEILSNQVKRLVKAESKLYEYQEQLDAQLREYKELHELNRKLNATFELRSIFEYATEYIINNLGYERVIIFQLSEGTGEYVVSAVEGYYDRQERSAVAKLSISQEDPFLSPLLEGGEDLLCKEGAGEHELAAYRTKMRMNEYLLIRLGSRPRPFALLAVGNMAGEAEPYRRVSDSEGALLGIGNLTGLLSSMIERRLAEEEIRRLNAELQKKIEELVAAQEELVRKEKLAILGQLSGSVGHELRNPLGVMSNAVYFLKMVLADADETIGEYLDIIKKEIDDSQRIITDLLDFARTRTPQAKVVTARELVGESIGRCAIPDHVELRTEIPETLPAVMVDPLQMGQVFQNLITNAVQAMPEGGALCVAACRRRGPETGPSPAEGLRTASGDQGPGNNPIPNSQSPIPDDFVEISVTDTGEGIAPENMSKLFQPLFTTKAKGIGLGLVVCGNLVEANGGRIEVESEAGKGTTFSVVLPAERSDV